MGWIRDGSRFEVGSGLGFGGGDVEMGEEAPIGDLDGDAGCLMFSVWCLIFDFRFLFLFLFLMFDA